MDSLIRGDMVYASRIKRDPQIKWRAVRWILSSHSCYFFYTTTGTWKKASFKIYTVFHKKDPFLFFSSFSQMMINLHEKNCQL